MSRKPVWRRKRWTVPSFVLLLLALAAGIAWTNRIAIADGYIADELERLELPATYQIERIGGQTQIIANLVIGEPEAPDFTADKVIVHLTHRLGLPEVGGVTLVNPRLYGRYIGGKLSFGSLDRVIFDDSEEATGLPDLDLAIRDGRGLLETDFGPIGLKLEGKGNLADGFAGVLAATAPQLEVSGCGMSGTTLFGTVSSAGGKPRFAGPLRMKEASCQAQDLFVSDFVADLDLTAEGDFSEQRLVAQLSTGGVRFDDIGTQSITGTLRAQQRDGNFNSRYTFAARGVETSPALLAVLTAEGTLRARENFARFEVESDLEGNGLRLGQSTITTVETLATSGAGTLLAPLARQIATALQRETRGSAIAATLRYRSAADGSALVIPEAAVRGGSGARLLSLSRFEVTQRGDGPAQMAGNVATGGPGLPRVNGRMENAAGGRAVFRLAMEPYRARGSALAIPELTVAQGDNGTLGFSGIVEASGPLPGGSVEQLVLPIRGSWNPSGELALWRQCTAITFRRLVVAQLDLAGPGVSLCPPSGQPMLRYAAGGVRFAAGTPSLELSGALGETPIRISSGPVGFAYPGQLRARDLAIALGPEDTASRFKVTDLDATLGEDIAGSFADAEIALAAVPMRLVNTAGDWRFAEGRLVLDDTRFRLLDRENPQRFEPLAARGARLTLVDNVITAMAELRNPGSDRLVTIADIRHNLATGAGHADLDVPGLRFDKQLQPAPSASTCQGVSDPRPINGLSCLALGIVANLEGTVTGAGRIQWSEDGDVTSSGTFSTDNLDFAAAFGPVKGASGTVRFTDLLNLTTAPGQRLRVASVNPGIEVFEGEIEYQIRDGELLSVSGGSWPFMGGRMILRPIDITFGKSEERRYIFEIVGLDASQFVAQMEFENISATGTFDGTVPIVFDSEGNGRIEEGMLLSRPPGGNISYVGDLTYEDLSTMANYAFAALRSLEYTQMSLIMEGPLTGEIITRVRFDGVRQGEGAESNFVTRQLAKLPIQFRINIRAQFYQLLTSLKAMYDPSSVRDPRELGLVSDDGTRLRRAVRGEEVQPTIRPEDVIPDEPTIQDQESE